MHNNIYSNANAFKTLVMRSLLFIILIFIASQPLSATVYNCNSIQEIRTAMLNAVAGDEIVIGAGTYLASDAASGSNVAHFYGSADGTAANPIIIRSASSGNPAILSGNNPSSKYVLHIIGDYWIVNDLKFTNAQKGIMLDNANHCEINNCEVYGIGYEGIHVRDGSDYTLIDGCYVHDTGTRKPGFGEGIYIGTDKGRWDDYDPYVVSTTVKNCILGPNIAAEALDIKEGTSETIVEYCTIDATGISGSNYADSFIDLKGIRTYVRYNTFNRNNATKLAKGIAGIDRGVANSCYEHAIHDNVFNMDTPTSGNMVEAYSGTSDIYAWDNIRNPSGNDYGNNIIDTCCPWWYNSGGSSCPIPTGLSSSAIDTAAATLSWFTVTEADSYDLRYQEAGSGIWNTVSVLTTNTYTLTGLLDNTTYAWEIRSSCGSLYSAYAIGDNFTTLEGASTDNGGGGTGGGADTSSQATTVIYGDALASDWNDYSFGGSYNLSYTSDVQIGSQSIRADYGSWGGLNLKHNNLMDATGLTAIRFWIKGEGDYLIRLKVNGAQHEFTTTTSWQQIIVALSDLGNPTDIESIVLQNRSSSNRTVFIDQIEFIGTGLAGGDNGSDGDSGGGDTPNNPTAVYEDALVPDWNDYSFSGNYDLAYTTDVQVGTHAIQANYEAWGGLNLKKGTDLDATGLTAIRFWVKGEGSYLIRLKVNGSQYEFITSTSWQQITVDLSEFGSPALLESVTFQNRSSSSRTVYYDQIEFIGNTGLQQPGLPVVEVTPSDVKWMLYPNPTTDIIYLECPFPLSGKVSIYSVSGQLMKQTQVKNNFTYSLPLDDLPSGKYLLSLATEEGMEVKPFVKK